MDNPNAAPPVAPNTLEEQTTIVGRPTYMATFAGAPAAGPIVEALTSIGYPRDDISVLLRPAGGDAVVDLLSGETAAGQDADAAQEVAAGQEATTLVLLHPEPAQIAAVRAALTGLGAHEVEYAPETIFTGDDAAAAIAATTAANVSTTNPANQQDVGPGASNRRDKDSPAATPAAAAASAPPPVDTSDLKAEVADLQKQVDDVKRDLERRD